MESVDAGGRDIPAAQLSAADADDQISRIRTELVERFGGLTIYARAPAEGLWKDGSDETERDELVVLEVMAEHWDPEWWVPYRARLERRLDQEEILIRATTVEKI